MSYADRNRRPPRTLTNAEIDRLLKVSGRDRDGYRDHVIFSLALGAGLREFEIVNLDVGDVLTEQGNVRQVINLRVFKNHRRNGVKLAAQRVALPPSAFYKLEKYARVEKLSEYYRDAPVFWSRKGNRLSVRAVRALAARWFAAAGIDASFHVLRHTAITAARREAKGDLTLTRIFARHVSVDTTSRYLHPTDDELLAMVAGLRC